MTKPDEWRERERKIYWLFRERLLREYPGIFNEFPALEMLTLMQHYGLPTRLIDFSLSPYVAAYFACRQSTEEGAIYVIDTNKLTLGTQEGYGPRHENGYTVSDKPNTALFMKPDAKDLRVRAQQACFVIQGHISHELEPQFISAKVLIPAYVAMEFLAQLRARDIDEARLFPNFDALAAELSPFITNGEARVPGLG